MSISSENTQSMRAFSPFFFFALFTTVFLAIFYNTVTNTAGLYIASELGGSHEMSVYPLVLFGLGNVLSVPLAKPLIARFGAIRSLIGCLWLYALFATLCVWSPTFLVFNFLRLCLGYASGPFYVLVSRLINTCAPQEKKPFFTSIMLTLFVVLPALGSSFGAWLAYETHWRWIFHINQPIAIFLALYFWCYIKQGSTIEISTVPAHHPSRQWLWQPDTTWQRAPFDRVGYLFYCIGLLALVLVTMLAQQLDWYRSPLIVALTGVALISLIFFLLWESYTPAPLLELRLLRNFQLSYSLLNIGVLFATYFGMIILIPLWLNIYANYTPIWIGILVGMMAISGLFVFFLSYRWLKHYHPLIPVALAVFFFAISCYYSTYFNIDIDFFHLSVARILAGFGLALFLPPLFQLVLASHTEAESADTFVLYQVTRCLSTSVGAGLYVILWQRRHVFFHERLGEQLTACSQLTTNFFSQAAFDFHLSPGQSHAQLDLFLEQQATALALNDALGAMGWVMVGLLALLAIVVIARLLRQNPLQPLSEKKLLLVSDQGLLPRV